MRRRHPSQPSVQSYVNTAQMFAFQGTNQGLHGSVKSMLVVATELWVGTLEGWVSASLWLLDTVVGFLLALSWTLFSLRGALSWDANSKRGVVFIPVTVSLLRLVVLGRVLGF